MFIENCDWFSENATFPVAAGSQKLLQCGTFHG